MGDDGLVVVVVSVSSVSRGVSELSGTMVLYNLQRASLVVLVNTQRPSGDTEHPW